MQTESEKVPFSTEQSRIDMARVLGEFNRDIKLCNYIDLDHLLTKIANVFPPERPTSQCPYRLHFMQQYSMEIISIARPSIVSANLDRTVTRTTRASASKMLESLNLKTIGRGFSDT